MQEVYTLYVYYTFPKLFAVKILAFLTNYVKNARVLNKVC